MPEGTGLWAALWLLPVTGNSHPEIDLFEVLGNDPAKMLMHLHPVPSIADTSGRTHVMPHGSSFSDGWRDVALDWEPGQLTYYVDGRQVWEVTGDQVPNQRMYLIANLAVGGVYPGPPSESTDFPSTYQVDYIRVQKHDR